MNAFVHLDVRSYFSLKDGAFSPEDLAVRAAELGMPAVAMTDRDGLYGAARFVSACTQVGVRPLLGATLTTEATSGPSRASTRSPELPVVRNRAQRSEQRVRGPESHRAFVVVLARDAAGDADLCRLITDSHMLGERDDPSLATEQLLAHSAGLF